MEVPLLSHLQNTNMIDIKINRNIKWDPLGFNNNLSESYNIATNLPQFDRATMKLTLLLLH